MKYTEELKTYCEQHNIPYRKVVDQLLASFETWQELEKWVKNSPSPQDAIDRLGNLT